MAKHHVSAAAIGLPLCPAVFIEVTPSIRRALELLATASIALLDEIDAPTDDREDDGDLEFDDDFEATCEDEGGQCDDEGFEGEGRR